MESYNFLMSEDSVGSTLTHGDTLADMVETFHVPGVRSKGC